MRHTNHDFLQTHLSAALNQLIHTGNKTFTAFQREPFLANVLRVQKTLKSFCSGQPLKNVKLLFFWKTGFAARRFQLLLPPAFLALVRHVHVFRANRAAVCFTQRIHQFAQAHGLFAEKGVARVEHNFLVGVCETVKRRFEFRDVVALGALQRIKICPTHADVAVSGNQLLGGRALATHFRVSTGHHHFGLALFGTFGKGIDDRQMRNVFGVAAIRCRNVLQRIKVFTPAVGDAAGVCKVVFVHLLDIRRVAAEEIGVAFVGRKHRGCGCSWLRV